VLKKHQDEVRSVLQANKHPHADEHYLVHQLEKQKPRSPLLTNKNDNTTKDKRLPSEIGIGLLWPDHPNYKPPIMQKQPKDVVFCEGKDF
jgi:hypothetical protein